MADVAASGGYYMAMAAGTIVAEKLTLTGSIGVVTGEFEGLIFLMVIYSDAATLAKLECLSLTGLSFLWTIFVHQNIFLDNLLGIKASSIL